MDIQIRYNISYHELNVFDSLVSKWCDKSWSLIYSPPPQKMLGRFNHLICKIHEKSRNFQIDIRAISEDVGEILCWFKPKEKRKILYPRCNLPFQEIIYSFQFTELNEWIYVCIKRVEGRNFSLEKPTNFY